MTLTYSENGLLSYSYLSSCLFSSGSKGTNKDGGSAGSNARGGNTPPALGDLFAGGFPVLRPAGQRDVAGKERSSLVAWWPGGLPLCSQQVGHMLHKWLYSLNLYI